MLLSVFFTYKVEKSRRVAWLWKALETSLRFMVSSLAHWLTMKLCISEGSDSIAITCLGGGTVLWIGLSVVLGSLEREMQILKGHYSIEAQSLQLIDC
jgi:hypothetical protein